CLLYCVYNVLYSYRFFFFSSRRRHTRFSRDWSSDVCSSDLPTAPPRSNPRRRLDRGLAKPGSRRRGLDRGGAVGRGRDGGSGLRSEERRVGKEGRGRWRADRLKKKKTVERLRGRDSTQTRHD